ncbi:hypothetical protein EOL94_03155 [bacterium]|nr:hypothetical protein [bacterium]
MKEYYKQSKDKMKRIKEIYQNSLREIERIKTERDEKIASLIKEIDSRSIEVVLDDIKTIK